MSFREWKDFDYDTSTVQLWVFKKSKTPERYRAWHIRTDREIGELFRDAIKSEASRITETIGYSHLSQNNESSCLQYPLENSDGLSALIDVTNGPELENVDASLKELKGAVGYLVKFQNNGETIFAFRKTAPTWRPAVRNGLINAMFHNGELSAIPEESFTFDSFFDFYCCKESILMASKKAYESIVSEKKVYKKVFEDLAVDPRFVSLFKDIAPLKNYVGTNAMHLKRMTVVKSKELYARPDFTERLCHVNQRRNWGIKFDSDQKIDVCADTVKVVIQVVLDHRLLSEVTDNTYDVPDAEKV